MESFRRPIPRLLLTAEECAASLGMSRDSFDRLVDAGEIRPGVRPFDALHAQRPTRGMTDPRWPMQHLEEFVARLIDRGTTASAVADALIRGTTPPALREADLRRQRPGQRDGSAGGMI